MATDPQVSPIDPTRHIACEYRLDDEDDGCSRDSAWMIVSWNLPAMAWTVCDAHLPWYCRPDAERYEVLGRSVEPTLRQLVATLPLGYATARGVLREALAVFDGEGS